MAPLASLSSCFAFFLLINFLSCSYSQTEVATRHVVSVQSLQPSGACKSPKGSDPSRLRLVHAHGPCSPVRPRQKPTQKQIFDGDEHRVEWLRNRAKSGSSKAKSDISLDATNLPARSGGYLGSGNYVITVAFGTPKVTQTIMFDTGSDVTWIQCQPCAGSCYKQAEQLFDPARSSTYTNISCSSPYCSALSPSGCLGSTCRYQVDYGDKSQTVGFYAKDTLTLAPSDVIPNFRFGCSEQNSGGFGRVAGLFGLGRLADVSFIAQTYGKYDGVFSYCLPSTPSTTGYMTFGRTSVPSNAQYTPMLTYTNGPAFYFVELVSISVGGKTLPIPPTLFSNAGVFLDSGTVITRLPPTAYSVLSSEFQKGMTKYPKAPGDGLLDTCYDFSNYQTVIVPSVALNFRGATVNVDFFGIIYMLSNTQGCLAFAPNGNDGDLVVIGNTQQKTYSVTYDLAKGSIGFSPKGC